MRLADYLGSALTTLSRSLSSWVPRSRCCVAVSDAIGVHPLSRIDDQHQTVQTQHGRQSLTVSAVNGSDNKSLHLGYRLLMRITWRGCQLAVRVFVCCLSAR